MMDPATLAVLAALTADGTPARFVGGCVRDAVAGLPVKDVDVATPLPPDEVARRIAAAGLRAVPTGIEHGTVTAVSGGRPFEITTLRRDVATDGRRAVVAFTDDWDEDASRRDLTFNALSLEPDGRLHDPFGGLDDLAAGRVRFIGDPRQRIREDVLRLLRFFRFLARYGRQPPADDQLAACRELAPLLPRLSGERVRAELLRLLSAEDPLPAWRPMIAEGILDHVLPEAVDPARLERMAAHDRALGLAPDGLLRLAAAIGGDGRAAAERLRLSNAERDRLLRALTPPWPVVPDMGERERRRALYRLGADGYRDLAMLAAAGDPAADGGVLRDDLAAAAAWDPPAFPLKGSDALERGVPAGPRVGELLAAVEAWWEEADFRPGRDACLAELERRIALT
jgi:poly(A) polymerase